MDYLTQQYSTPIKINGTEEDYKEFIRKCEEFAPIVERIMLNAIYDTEN